MKNKRKSQQFVVTIYGENIHPSMIENVLVQGFNFYDDIEWASLSADKVGDWRVESGVLPEEERK